jgi:hypothetical protein
LVAFNLPPSVNTPQLLEAVHFEVERLRTWLSDRQVKQKVGAFAGNEPSRSPETQVVIDGYLEGKVMTPELLSGLLDELAKLKPVTVHLTLAALPSESLKRTLIDWFRTNCRADLLINFSADRTIGGGLIVRTPNRIFDYSFRQRLIDGRSKIPELIHHVG